MAEYIVQFNNEYERYTFLGDVRKRRKILEENGVSILVKRHYTSGFRPVYETNKFDKIFESRAKN